VKHKKSDAEDRDLASDLVAEAADMVVPVVGGVAASRILAAVRAEWRRSMSQALKAAEQAMGLSREDLAELLERDPRTVPLYVKVLLAAGMNGHDATLRAMGAAFAAAAQASARGDDDSLEDAELALSAMASFTPRHFRVLGALAEGQIALGEDGNANYGHFMPETVATRANVGESVAHQCLLTLAGAGLATVTNVLGGIAYPITDLGRAVLQASATAKSDP
jgi:hypothetical protein